MATTDRKAERPPLKPADVYRPRLGTQRAPLSKTTMAELRAWRAAKTANGRDHPETTAQAR
jgi:hypothetical protein